MENSRPIRVAIYARVSTEEQAEHGYSIDAQVDVLRKHCRDHGKVVAGEYVDRGVSGKEMTRRHELKRMLKDAKERAFDEVVVWKLNRLSRKTRDLLEIVDELGRNNVYFRSCSENFETETPAGKLTFQMLGVIGEFERNTIVENVKLGMKQRARMGYRNGGRCLGYRTLEEEGGDRRSRRTKLEVVPEEALVVRKIFELYASGKGFRAIANQLNREGHRTVKGNTFGSDSVREIVTNPVYAGTIRYNRFEGWSEKRRRGKNSKPILAEGKHEAIIGPDLWARVQALFQQKSKAMPRTYDGVSLLTGLIRCPQCGSAMVASRTVNYLKDGSRVIRRYYSCGAFRSKGSSVCRANSVGADYAERYVVGRIKEVLTRPEVLRDIVEAVNAKRVAGVGPMQQELKAIDKSLADLAARKKKLMDIFEADAIDQGALVARLDELTAEEDALQARRSEISYELGTDMTAPVALDDVQRVLTRLDELLDKSPSEQKKTLLHLAIREITVREGRQIDKITFTFDDKTRGCLIDEDPPATEKAGGSFCIQV